MIDLSRGICKPVFKIGFYGAMPKELNKYSVSRSLKNCRDPGSNRGPLDLQSNALPTELSRLDA
jgi:hypothetical protein